MTLRFLTSGESHGRGLLLILEGFPRDFFSPGRPSRVSSAAAAGDLVGVPGWGWRKIASPSGEGCARLHHRGPLGVCSGEYRVGGLEGCHGSGADGS